MDALKTEIFRDVVLLLQAFTMLALAYLGKLTLELHRNSKENKPKIEETRENVSRIINGKGVAHDHERNRRHSDAPDLPPEASRDASPSQAPSIAPHCKGEP